MTTAIKKGDRIRENRMGAKTEEVLEVRGNMIRTYQGNDYHVTKIVKAEPDQHA